MNVYSNFIRNSQKQPRCPSTDEWLTKLWYIHAMVLLSSNKEQTIDTCNNLEKSQGNYVEWKKSVSKVCTTYLIPYIKHSWDDKLDRKSLEVASG